MISNIRKVPNTNEYILKDIVEEKQTCGQDNAHSLFGFYLEEVPVYNGDELIVLEKITAEGEDNISFTEVDLKTNPSDEQFRVDYFNIDITNGGLNRYDGTGWVTLNSSHDAEEFLITYKGVGSSIRTVHVVNRSVDLEGSLEVSGSVSLEDTLSVEEDFTVETDVSIGGNLVLDKDNVATNTEHKIKTFTNDEVASHDTDDKNKKDIVSSYAIKEFVGTEIETESNNITSNLQYKPSFIKVNATNTASITVTNTDPPSLPKLVVFNVTFKNNSNTTITFRHGIEGLTVDTSVLISSHFWTKEESDHYRYNPLSSVTSSAQSTAVAAQKNPIRDIFLSNSAGNDTTNVGGYSTTVVGDDHITITFQNSTIDSEQDPPKSYGVVLTFLIYEGQI